VAVDAFGGPGREVGGDVGRGAAGLQAEGVAAEVGAGGGGVAVGLGVWCKLAEVPAS